MEQPEYTLIQGRDFAWQWVLSMGMLLALGGFGYMASEFGLVLGLLGAVGAVCISLVLAVPRGFRLKISDAGFRFSRTWLGVTYWSKRLPITAECKVNEGLDFDGDGVILERELHSEDIGFGSSKNCAALQEAIAVAKARWQQA